MLLALPAEPFDAAEAAAPRVDQKSLVTIRQNRYSVPVALAGLKVSARVGAREITISHGGRVVARHERLHGKFATSAQLDHYLELLAPQARRPGALRRAGPGTRPRRLARLLRRALGRADRSLRALGGRRADGRRRVALSRARPRARSSSRSAAR